MTQLLKWVTSLVCLLCSGSVELWADGVSIEGHLETGSLNMTLDHATLADVLHAVQAKYGVEVHGIEAITDTDPISAKFEGTLSEILNRLLRNSNFSIVRSSTSPSGVVKVFIAPKGPPPKAPPEAPPKNVTD